MLPLLQHLLTPGDHYSPATGSAVVTVAHGLNREHQRVGGLSTVAVAADTYADRYLEGRTVEFERGSPLPRRGERLRDAALGALGRTRPASRASWRPAAATVLPEGAALVHNGLQVGHLLPPGVQRVLYVHNSLLRSYSPWEARRAIGNFDSVIAVSQFLADEFERRAGCRRPISVVYNGVDVEQFFPAAEREPGPPRVFFVGRVIPQKGAHLLVDAALRLKSLDFVLTIVGNQGFSAALPLSLYEQQLRWAAAPLGDRVHFSPFVNRRELPTIMRRADILVVPSLVPEGLGLVLLEAMASGAACIVANAGGLPEAAGDAARIFARGDGDALTGLLEQMLTVSTDREALGTAGRVRAKRFTWATSHQRLLAALTA